MKKLLLGTSAMALAGAFASPADAVEWEVKIGGYMEQYLAYAETDAESVSGDFDGVDVKSDAEISFRPSITLDNGLKFLMNAELEVNQDGGVDEPYLDISGSFGSVRLGEDDIASYTLAYTAPDVSFLGINSGSDVVFFAPESLLTTFTHTLPQTATDPVGISYYSPRLAGFQIGASYARDANRSDNDEQIDDNASDELHDIWAVGANYVNSFGDFNIAASGGYSEGSLNGHDATGKGLYYVPESGSDVENNNVLHVTCDGYEDKNPEAPEDAVVLQSPDCVSTGNSDPRAWAAGLNLGYGGFTIGGSYYKEYDDRPGNPETWDVGVSYETGPWGFSFTYLRYDDNEDLDVDRYLLATTYTIAQGVTLLAFGNYAEAEQGDVKDDGFSVGTGVKVSF